MTPVVSVVMPVYNGEKFLAEAIESILTQTFTDFELLIVDDFSEDSSPEIIKKYQGKDRRITLLENANPKGVSGARNTGLANARGEYVAWMDADDASLPNRVRTQLDFLQAHPEVAVCGSFLSVYEDGSRWACPAENGSIKCQLLFNSPLFQPTVMMRTKKMADAEWRYTAKTAEDYDLWARLSLDDRVVFANVPQVLLRYRVHPGSARAKYKESQRHAADAIRKTLLARLGIAPTEKESACHELFAYHGAAKDSAELYLCGRWLEKIRVQNGKGGVYDEHALELLLSASWRELCWRSADSASLAPLLFFLPAFTPKGLGSARVSAGILCKRWGLR